MKTKYSIGNRFVFIPKNNSLVEAGDNNNLFTLGTNETRLLEYLIEHRNVTVPRQELISILWNNRDIYVDDSSLTQSVSTLRKALGDSAKPPMFIKTVPKVGYEFIATANRINVEKTKRGSNSQNKANDKTNNIDNSIKDTLTPPILILNKQLIRFEVFILLIVLTLLAERLYWLPR